MVTWAISRIEFGAQLPRAFFPFPLLALINPKALIQGTVSSKSLKTVLKLLMNPNRSSIWEPYGLLTWTNITARSTEGLEFRRTGHHLAVETGSDSKPSVSPWSHDNSNKEYTFSLAKLCFFRQLKLCSCATWHLNVCVCLVVCFCFCSGFRTCLSLDLAFSKWSHYKFEIRRSKLCGVVWIPNLASADSSCRAWGNWFVCLLD